MRGVYFLVLSGTAFFFYNIYINLIKHIVKKLHKLTCNNSFCIILACPSNWFTCISNGLCLPTSQKCDGQVQCADGSDESKEVCGKN